MSPRGSTVQPAGVISTNSPAGLARSRRRVGAVGGRREPTRRWTMQPSAVGVAEGAGFEEVEDGAEGGGEGTVGDVGEVLAEEPVAEGGGAEGDGLEGADVAGAGDVGVGAVFGGGEDFDVFDDAG